MKQKYCVNVHYDVILCAVVIAENEEEALGLAVQQTESLSLDNGEVCDIQPYVTNIEKF